METPIETFFSDINISPKTDAIETIKKEGYRTKEDLQSVIELTPIEDFKTWGFTDKESKLIRKALLPQSKIAEKDQQGIILSYPILSYPILSYPISSIQFYFFIFFS